jgi:hypothetical protein
VGVASTSSGFAEEAFDVGWRFGVWVQRHYGFGDERVQAVASLSVVLEELLAHSGRPEALDMVSYAGDSFVVRVGLKKQGDLVDDVHHLAFVHDAA